MGCWKWPGVFLWVKIVSEYIEYEKSKHVKCFCCTVTSKIIVFHCPIIEPWLKYNLSSKDVKQSVYCAFLFPFTSVLSIIIHFTAVWTHCCLIYCIIHLISVGNCLCVLFLHIFISEDKSISVTWWSDWRQTCTCWREMWSLALRCEPANWICPSRYLSCLAEPRKEWKIVCYLYNAFINHSSNT